MRTPLRRAPDSQRGFTLIEMMIAMLIMGIGMLTMGLAHLSSMRIASNSKQMSQAMYLAQEQLDTFLAFPPAAGGTFQDPNNPIEVQANDQDLTSFTRSWTVTRDTPLGGVATVVVRVVWDNSPNDGLSQNLRTINLQGIVEQ